VKERCVGSGYNKNLLFYHIRIDGQNLIWDTTRLDHCHLPARAPEPMVPTIFASRTAVGRKVLGLGYADIVN